MKKKGPRAIPSFAPTKNKPVARPDQLDPKAPAPPPPPRPPAIKPQSTSQKSGRRGS
jgi:hypothetical protein